MAHFPGTRLGSYEILCALGAGGMGEVYRAHDASLGRDVAIKILPDTFAHDPERRARFAREARTLAALNHPNIAHVYGFETSAGVHALVMELVEGPTLADRIALGSIPIDQALAIARQIAEALEAAHEQGIVHRDVKPANVKVRDDGAVKVLDFGLAKALEPAGVPASVSLSPTITTPAMTQAGMILGTAAYMSPEQAKGKAADKRSDIWAFGCVLYEMLTGARVFAGDDVGDTLAAVLRGEPDWHALPIETPAPIRRLLRRCLEKDRRRRLSDAADARLEIDDALTAAVSDTSATSDTPGWRRVSLIATPDGTQVVFYEVTPTQQRDIRLLTLTPSPQVKPLVETRFDETGGVVSPDGRWLAYESNSTGAYEVFVRPFPAVDGGLWPVSTAGGVQPLWAPNGRELFYVAPDGALMAVAVEARGSVWSAGAPARLLEGRYFHGGEGLSSRQYDVTADGQRFLMIKNEAIDIARPTPRRLRG